MLMVQLDATWLFVTEIKDFSLISIKYKSAIMNGGVDAQGF